MLNFIVHTPLFVWPLLIYILYIGIKSSKTVVVPLKVLLYMPLVFSLWSAYSVFTRYGMSSGFFWALCFAVGIVLGIRLVSKLSIRFDKEKKLIELPGTWLTLVFALSIFSIRYFLGATYSLHPEFIGSKELLALELTATAISGTLFGRYVGYLRKYKQAPHENLPPSILL